MTGLIKDMIEGFIILAILCGIYGLSNDVMTLAGMAQKDGLVSLTELTKMLVDKLCRRYGTFTYCQAQETKGTKKVSKNYKI